MPQLHLIISGKVQGVLYRQHAHKKATSLGLTGWIRNLPDGRVETFAEGGTEELEEFLDWCYEGTPASNVEHIQERWQNEADQFQDFRIIG